MLSHEENHLLTRTGPSTPAGGYFRCFWLPALLASELPGPDCPPVRLRLLGEDLIAFRDTNGRIGVIDEFCPHRRASLFWGRNEECGLRCVYHGWKFDVTGDCVDMPNEAPGYGFENKVRTLAYSAREYGGVIWLYMGTPQNPPELPKLEWARVPESHRYVSKRRQETNYLQAIEGGIDSSHSNFLHASLDAFRMTDAYLEKARNSSNLRAKYHLLDRAPKFLVKKTDYGLVIAVRRNAEEDTYYWRLTQFLLPSHTMIPYQKGLAIHAHCWVPRDDHTCWVWTMSWNPQAPLSEEEWKAIREETFVHAEVDPVTFRPVRNLENDYLIDRAQQRTSSMTGIHGFATQDQAIQESMGPIVDRTRERLGTSDTAIIAMRRLLLQEIRALQKNQEPFAARHGDLYWVRSASMVLSREVPFEEAARELIAAEV
ncbi:MAG: aromatic ring-hydroxylating dioxygenase subunit alpha [Acidobacteriia bacterium]|nr:aromatic ring-hydroxylating dioxygenase subunit alpha [Terriglobia bacterium]